MILHVVGRGVGEDDGGFGLADNRSDLFEQWDGVGQFEVVTDGGIEFGAENAGGFAGLR